MFVLYTFGAIRFLSAMFTNYGKHSGTISKNISSLFMTRDELVRVDLLTIALLEASHIFLDLKEILQRHFFDSPE